MTSSRPTRNVQITNLVVSQIGWFAAVLSAAHGLPLLGTACVLAAIGWHLRISARPRQEARLIAFACLIGFVFESVNSWQGNVRYPSGQFDPRIAPYWIVALWGLLAIALNVTVRWLKPHLWLAALVGGVAGPVSFSSGVRLGGADFVRTVPALAVLALGWSLLLPLLVWLSTRFDGVAVASATDA